MGVFGGGGADNLDYNMYSFPQLRAAVLGVDEEGIRVAANEWADLKRRLHERTGTLHVLIAKLQPAWDSPAGRQALAAFRAHRDWMAEIAKVAAWNEDQADQVQQARHKAVKAMKALDAQPGGPNPPGAPPTPNPAPAPAPGNRSSASPASDDWRQPHAVKIARYIYGQMAIAAASMARAPQDHKNIDLTSGPLGDRIPGDGPVAPNPAPARGPRSGQPQQGGPRSGSPSSNPSRIAPTAPGNPPPAPGVPGAVAPIPRRLPSPGAGAGRAHAPRPGGNPSTTPGQTTGRSWANPSTHGPHGDATAPPARGQAGEAPPGGRSGQQPDSPSPPPPPQHHPEGRTLGGSRPPTGAPTPTAAGGDVTPSTPPGVSAANPEPPSRPKAKKPGRPGPEANVMFVDQRTGNRPGGMIGRPAGQTSQPASTDPGPGVLGAQKHKPAKTPKPDWDVPERTTPREEPVVQERQATQQPGTRLEVTPPRGRPQSPA